MIFSCPRGKGQPRIMNVMAFFESTSCTVRANSRTNAIDAFETASAKNTVYSSRKQLERELLGDITLTASIAYNDSK